MRIDLRPIPYWGLFGLAILASLVLIVRMITWLTETRAEGSLTKEALGGAFVLAIVALALLVMAGWAVVHRPKARKFSPADPLFA